MEALSKWDVCMVKAFQKEISLISHSNKFRQHASSNVPFQKALAVVHCFVKKQMSCLGPILSFYPVKE
jgi:hypothetical protein